MEFLTLKDLKLNPAGYLISATTNKPVTNTGFIRAQEAAAYACELASAIKDKNFKINQVDDLERIKKEVKELILNKKETTFFELPEKPKSKVNEELVEYALKFVDFQNESDKVNQLNKMMEPFKEINEVETIGDYFVEGLVKLHKLYTIEDIKKALEITVNKLD